MSGTDLGRATRELRHTCIAILSSIGTSNLVPMPISRYTWSTTNAAYRATSQLPHCQPPVSPTRPGVPASWPWY
eukprot:2180578-Rhodomonas_salina.6